MEIRFLGSIGYLMAGSGLQEVLEVIYAGNAVKHNYAEWKSNLQSSARTSLD